MSKWGNLILFWLKTWLVSKMPSTVVKNMVVCLLFGWLVCTSSEQGGGFSSSEVFAAVRA